jgi:hypothetical protein
MLTILFGSNWFIDTNGVVTFVDESKNIRKDLFKIELRADNKPMISVEVRDTNNQLLGRVHRSTSFVTVHPDYESSSELSGSDVKRLLLKNKQTNKQSGF